MSPKGVTRDLWVNLAGPTKPEYGFWYAPSGKAVHEALADEGPPGVQDVEWYLQPPQGHRGKRLVDALWHGTWGLKVYSDRLCEVMESCGARLRTWPADVRFRDGSPVEGYRTVLEEADAPGPVHSAFRGRRVGMVVINDEVRRALVETGMTGLEIWEVASPFPGDHDSLDRPG